MAVSIDTSLLAPVVALCIWTLFMEAWMYATRIPAANKYQPPMHPEASIADFNSRIPRNVQWKADNYNHLMEQPTQYYAVVLVLAILGEGNGLNQNLAWAYVGLRVAHSLIQATTNIVMLRFAAFGSSSVVLLGLTARAALLVF